jgi:hypothetical protein
VRFIAAITMPLRGDRADAEDVEDHAERAQLLGQTGDHQVGVARRQREARRPAEALAGQLARRDRPPAERSVVPVRLRIGPRVQPHVHAQRDLGRARDRGHLHRQRHERRHHQHRHDHPAARARGQVEEHQEDQRQDHQRPEVLDRDERDEQQRQHRDRRQQQPLPGELQPQHAVALIAQLGGARPERVAEEQHEGQLDQLQRLEAAEVDQRVLGHLRAAAEERQRHEHGHHQERDHRVEALGQPDRSVGSTSTIAPSSAASAKPLANSGPGHSRQCSGSP